MEALEPSDDARMDLRFALLCTVIANHSMGRKTAARLEEYLLDFSEREETEPADPHEQARTLRDQMLGMNRGRHNHQPGPPVAEPPMQDS